MVKYVTHVNGGRVSYAWCRVGQTIYWSTVSGEICDTGEWGSGYHMLGVEWIR